MMDVVARALKDGEVLAVVGLPEGAAAELAAAWPGAQVLDHPVRAAGYFARLWLRDELADRLAQADRAVLLLTDEVEEAAQLADRVLVVRASDVIGDVVIEVPRPRGRTDSAVLQAVEVLVSLLGPQHARCA